MCTLPPALASTTLAPFEALARHMRLDIFRYEDINNVI